MSEVNLTGGPDAPLVLTAVSVLFDGTLTGGAGHRPVLTYPRPLGSSIIPGASRQMSCPNVAKNMANVTPNVKNFFSRGGPREANVIGKIGIFLVDGSGEYGHLRPCAPQLAVDAEVIMASESSGVCQKADG